jgi:hypothetical protein
MKITNMKNIIDIMMSGHPSDYETPMEAYRKELEKFLNRMESEKPRLQDYDTEEEFNKDMAKWNMAYWCDRPNEPGYYRANND